LLFLGNSKHVGMAVPPEEMTTALQDALFDCDWLPYDVFERDTNLAGKEIKLFGERYKVLVVPPVEVIPYGTLEKAKLFFDAGGVVIGYGFLPGKSATLGKTGKDIAALDQAIWGEGAHPGLAVRKTNGAGGRSYLLSLKPTPEDIQQVLTKDAGVRPTLEVAEGITDHWLHVLHRVKADRDIFFVANQNLTGGARSFKLRVTAKGEPECWDAMRNEITTVRYRRLGETQVEISLALEPYESLLLVFNPEKRPLPMRLDPEAHPARQISVERDQGMKGKGSQSPTDGAQKIMAAFAWRTRLWIKAKGKLTLSPVKANPFNGKCNLPADLDLTRTRVYLVCEKIAPEAAARVTVNGRYAGGFIEKPLRLEVTDYLKPGTNSIRIEPFSPKNARLAVFAETVH